MARITTSGGPSNDPQGRYDAIHQEGGGEPSLGTSSSISESTLDKSGTSGTTDLQSPARSADSPSSPGQVPSQVPPSTVHSKDGSGQETGSSLASPSDSSEDSAPPREVTPDQVRVADLDEPEPEPAAEPYAGLSGLEAMELARQEYSDGNFDEAERLLAVAENRGEDSAAIARARGYIAAARRPRAAASPAPAGGTGGGFGEEEPTAGGALVP